MFSDKIIGKSSAWLEALDHISRLAPIDRAVLILGERGTGKEIAAERLHYLSPRWEKPLVKVNCAGFTDSLLESELFGYEPGAFTGATRIHHGRFERAEGGTLFLDELGTMPARVQEKVLRIIEYGEYERLGGQKTLTADVRIVAATNADLRAMAKRNEFRSDLLDRLTFDIVHLPSLRNRKDDIEELANHFAIRMSHELGWELFPGFSRSAIKMLLNYCWPGNIRELKNTIERSVYRWNNENRPIAQVVINPFETTEPPPQETGPVEPTENISDTNKTELDKKTMNFADAVQDFEITLLTKVLQESQFRQKEAAKKLGLSYNQFRGLYRKYQLGDVKPASTP